MLSITLWKLLTGEWHKTSSTVETADNKGKHNKDKDSNSSNRLKILGNPCFHILDFGWDNSQNQDQSKNKCTRKNFQVFKQRLSEQKPVSLSSPLKRHPLPHEFKKNFSYILSK